MSAGRKHTCGVQPDGKVKCWGWNHYGQTGVPSECWNSAPYGGGSPPPSYCPGWFYDGPLLPGGSTPSPFLSVSAGGNHSCGVLTDHRVGCRGRNDAGQRVLPGALFLDNTFRAVSAGFAHTCGVHIDGSADCWGNGGDNRASPPANTAFISVSAGWYHSCGLQTDRTVVCWGRNDYQQVSDAPGGTFSQVSVGKYHGCGLKTNGEVVCWGRNNKGQTSPLP